MDIPEISMLTMCTILHPRDDACTRLAGRIKSDRVCRRSPLLFHIRQASNFSHDRVKSPTVPHGCPYSTNVFIFFKKCFLHRGPTLPYFARRNIDTRFACRKHKYRYIHMNVNMDADDFSRGRIPRTRIPFVAILLTLTNGQNYFLTRHRRDILTIKLASRPQMRSTTFSFYRDLARSCTLRIEQNLAYRASWIQP